MPEQNSLQGWSDVIHESAEQDRKEREEPVSVTVTREQLDLVVDAVGHPDVLDTACRMARKAGTVSVVGVYAERCEVHMGIVWIKALTIRTGTFPGLLKR